VAIYRPKQRRWSVAAGFGAVGLVVGFLVGVALRPEPDPVEALGEIQDALRGAAGSLEVLEVEYAESVVEGDIVSTPEYEGARAALASSRERYAEVREAVASVAPDTVGQVDRAYDELENLVDQRAPSEEVAALAGQLSDMLTEALGA
jgi:hypothetical protein